jgi:maltooligosyltrehalose trehalohydrolase
MSSGTSRRCGALAGHDRSVHFRVWAPRAAAVELVLIDGERRLARMMTRAEHGYFEHTEPDVADGRRYAYRLDGGPERPDPASLWQPDGVHAPSAVYRPDRFQSTDGGWPGVSRAELVIYELHVGTFTPAGTFDTVIPRLESLRQLGVTAVELMPVAQFPGGRNWGYDGVHPYAAQNSYGGPHGLQRLVDACHAAGLAVILDVVYNHLGPEGNYLREFGPYFTDRYKTPWGDAVNYDGAGSDAVRDFVLDNVRMWLDEFRIDGLRSDAVHAIYDLGARNILRAIQETADECGRRRGWPAHLIAESDLNDPKLLLPPERGGYGLSGQWSDDFHHAVHALLTGERQGYYADFGGRDNLAAVMREPFLYAGRYSPFRDRKHGAPAADLPGDQFVVCLQNHDQVGNRAAGDRLDALVVGPSARRLAASLMLLAPHVPLIFMGEEYGETNPFPFFCSFSDSQLVESVRAGRRAEFAAFAWQGEVPDPQSEATFASATLSWSWDDRRRAGLRRLYADLLAARRQWPALRDFQRRSSHLIDDAVLQLVRGGENWKAGETLVAYFNLTDAVGPRLTPPEGTVLLFSSECERYGGPGGADTFLPHACLAYGPPSWGCFGT